MSKLPSSRLVVKVLQTEGFAFISQKGSHIKFRKQNKITLTEKMHAGDKKSLREIRFLPDEYKFQSIMFLYSQKVILVSGQQKEFNAVVIENTEFAKMWQQIFEMLWRNNNNVAQDCHYCHSSH
ncbi:MAG: hypothetical protein COU83_00555 [Candidatus Portnoybacteria bacterium CG10_big_fil_rev_8_21_14_0_10_40_22]|uniref:Type II toxin-antitoxin system HicA family toxin n=2 Tax=Candidatus Portnoyibacteriota TaxID=1817913 RepID=A0A2M8KGL7_9BACT|nr:MAG: hypothetical protein AUJ33_02610 [Parcubacteria group bacterium CG1_02_40_25]PJE59060.1 MAG: hypothetical protein COU83_00555 [Candidatus Portnoybacteria bacterium CG10_big_fil_rev_8_21_14_0_10_40_22]